MERGGGARASIETWSCLAAAVGEQFVGFLERAAGADRPRDIEHLRRQSALIELAAVGGWEGLPELALDSGPGRSRSIDVALVRRSTGEAVVVEIWDWFDDVGSSLRGLDAKVSALEVRLAAASTTSPVHGSTAAANGVERRPSWRVYGLFVVRDTRRNRSLVAQLGPLFAARFSGSSIAWIRAILNPSVPVPDRPGLVWSDSTGTSLRAARLGRPGRRR